MAGQGPTPSAADPGRSGSGCYIMAIRHCWFIPERRSHNAPYKVPTEARRASYDSLAFCPQALRNLDSRGSALLPLPCQLLARPLPWDALEFYPPRPWPSCSASRTTLQPFPGTCPMASGRLGPVFPCHWPSSASWYPSTPRLHQPVLPCTLSRSGPSVASLIYPPPHPRLAVSMLSSVFLS